MKDCYNNRDTSARTDIFNRLLITETIQIIAQHACKPDVLILQMQRSESYLQLNPVDLANESSIYGHMCFQNHQTKNYKGNTTGSRNISVRGRCRKYSSCKKLFAGTKAPFTRVRTNFCTDKNFHGYTGSVYTGSTEIDEF